MNGYHEKQVNFLKGAGVDVAGLQEASECHAKRLAEALGWSWHQDDGNDSVGFISRFPILQRHANIVRGCGVQLALNLTTGLHPLVPVLMAHTGLCFVNKDAVQITADENEAGRPDRLQQLVNKTTSMRNTSTPFAPVGDINAPSHLDWTLKNNENHCGNNFNWPSSEIPEEVCFGDSFGTVHSDPKAVDGNTWSPIDPKNAEDWPEHPEPQDRIDLITGQTILK